MSSPTQAERMRAACAAVTLDISARTRAKIPEASTQMVADIVQGHVEILADLSGVLLRTPLPTPTPLEAAREAFTVAALEMYDATRVGDGARNVVAFEFTKSAYEALRALSPQPCDVSDAKMLPTLTYAPEVLDRLREILPPIPTPLEAAREAFTVAAFAEHLAHHDLQAILDDKASSDDECARLAELRNATGETTDEAFDALRALSPQPGEGS